MREINGLVPVVQEKLEKLRAAALQKGISFIVTSTLRTEAEQLALFAQGRKTVDEVNRLRRDAGMAPVTEAQNKRPVTWELTSMHMFGCAFDVCVLRNGVAIWTDCKEYESLGLLGEHLGLKWGGRFSVRDLGHFQYTGGLSMEELRGGKRPTA